MTVQSCYAAMGGDYADVFGRLRTDERIQKFLSLFLKDTSFSDLTVAVKGGHAEDAFRAAHTLKGICGNLSLTKLLNVIVELTEMLRGKTEVGQDVAMLLPTAQSAYEETVQAIHRLID